MTLGWGRKKRQGWEANFKIRDHGGGETYQKKKRKNESLVEEGEFRFLREKSVKGVPQKRMFGTFTYRKGKGNVLGGGLA